jgi:putative transcriptional regulator
MPLRNRLKEMRARLNINQQELGTMVGASRQTISLIERGDYYPSVLLVLKIAEVFKVPVEEIFILEEEQENGTENTGKDE